MKKLLLLLMLLFPSMAFADRWDAAISRNAGNSPVTFAVNVTSVAPVAITDSSYGVQSATIDIFNNTAFTLWIGTNTTTLQGTGFPILSSTTYTTDGTFTGTLYGSLDTLAGAGIKTIRTIYYIKNDALRP
jgi:hypothetical protein